LGLILALALYALFGVLDLYVAPGVAMWIWLIRYAIFCPVTLAALGLSFTRRFSRLMQPPLCTVAAVAGLGIVAIAIARPPAGDLLTPAHGAWARQIMAAHHLGGTLGKRNPHALRWFCRCTIKEDTRYLAMPVCAHASTGWPADKAAADPPAAGAARQPGHGPDPDGLAAAAGGQPGAVRADRRRGDKTRRGGPRAAATSWPCPRPGRSCPCRRWPAGCRPG